MQPGEIFNRYGSCWIAKTVTRETNKRFQWLVVKAYWSWFGPMPRWHTEPRIFLMNRQGITND